MTIHRNSVLNFVCTLHHRANCCIVVVEIIFERFAGLAVIMTIAYSIDFITSRYSNNPSILNHFQTVIV